MSPRCLPLMMSHIVLLQHNLSVPVVHSESETDSNTNPSDHDTEENDISDVVNDNEGSIPRRSSRLRQAPNRFGDPFDHGSSSSIPGENEVTQLWWPGYPRGSWFAEQ